MKMEDSRRKYYWLTTVSPEGKHFLIFGGSTEEEARARGLEQLAGVDFQIKLLPTRDLGRASSLLKGNRLEKTHSLRKAGERIGHERSIRRLKGRTG